MSTAITLNGNSLQTSQITTRSAKHRSGPDVQAAIYALANANRSIMVSAIHPSKRIILKGQLKAASASALDSLCDTFKGYFTTGEMNLDIDYAGATRRYVVVAEKEPIIDGDDVSIADWTANLLSLQYGMDTTNTTIVSASGRTSGTYNDAHTFLGNAPEQYPVITITLTAVTGGSAASIFVGNNGTGQQLTITRTWSASDVLVIDTFNRTVKVNNVEVDFSGALPLFAPGAGTLGYVDTFTTRTFTISAVYAKRWK